MIPPKDFTGAHIVQLLPAPAVSLMGVFSARFVNEGGAQDAMIQLACLALVKLADGTETIEGMIVKEGEFVFASTLLSFLGYDGHSGTTLDHPEWRERGDEIRTKLKSQAVNE